MPTLKELEVEVGDIVKYLDESEYEVLSDYKLKTISTGIISNYKHNWGTIGYFTLVSRSTPKNTIVVGGKYTIKDKVWECIFVDEELAWMRINKYSTAYIWKTDGTAVTMGKDYSVKWIEKIVKSVVVNITGSLCVPPSTKHEHYFTGELTVTTINGKPDWKTLKVTSEDS